jgi:hypothetical protein
MARIFEDSLVAECVEKFRQYIESYHRREGGPGNSPDGIFVALMMWLLDGDAFDAVGDSYELFLRTVVAVIMLSNLDPTTFWCEAVEGPRYLVLKVVANDNTVWLTPEDFRLQLYRKRSRSQGELDAMALSTS